MVEGPRPDETASVANEAVVPLHQPVQCPPAANFGNAWETTAYRGEKVMGQVYLHDWAHGLGILISSSRAWVADRQHFDNFHAPWCVHGHFVATTGSCLDQRRGDWGCQADLAHSHVGLVHAHNRYGTFAFRATGHRHRTRLRQRRRDHDLVAGTDRLQWHPRSA